MYWHIGPLSPAFLATLGLAHERKDAGHKHTNGGNDQALWHEISPLCSDNGASPRTVPAPGAPLNSLRTVLLVDHI